MATTKKAVSTDLVERGRRTTLGTLTSGIGGALAMMKTASDLANTASNALKVAQTVGATVRATRETQQMSLNELAKRAGVSKSMISRVEQGLTSPTAVMLAKLAEGMTVSLSSLLRGEFGPPVHIQTEAEQPIFKDPKTGLVRRTLSPVSPDASIEIVHNTLPAKKTTGAFPAHSPGTQEHIVVLAGKIEVSVGRRTLKLSDGDAAQFVADIEHSIKNVGTRKAEWILVIYAPARGSGKK